MIKNIFILFKIGRVLSKSNTLSYFNKIYKIPFFLKIIIKIFGFSILNLNIQIMSLLERDFRQR